MYSVIRYVVFFNYHIPFRIGYSRYKTNVVNRCCEIIALVHKLAFSFMMVVWSNYNLNMKHWYLVKTSLM